MTEAAQTKNLIALGAVVSREVDQDEVTITFETIELGSESNQVQETLMLQLGEAITHAKAALGENENIRIETGTFSVTPRFTKKMVPDGYEGTAQLVVTGTDTTAISKFAGELKSMRVVDISYAVSRKTRIALESEMAADAIAEFKTRAAQYTKNFGLKTYTLVTANVSVNLQNYRGGSRMAALSVSSFGAAGGGSAAESMPMAGSKETLTAQVSGSIQLK